VVFNLVFKLNLDFVSQFCDDQKQEAMNDLVFSLSTATLRLGSPVSCSTSLFLSVILRILILSVLSVLRSSGFVSHA